MKKVNKKVLIITPTFGNNGITKVILSIVENIKDISFSIAACSIDDSLLDIGVDYIKLPNQESVAQYFKAIKKEVRDGDYDTVYIHANSALMIVESMACKFARKCKVITHCHNSSTIHPIGHRLVKPFLNIFVDEKVGCCKFSSKWAYTGNKNITIKNGIDVDEYKFNTNVRKEKRDLLNVNDEEVLIGNFSRLSYQKNQRFLLEIFMEYLKLNAKAKLLLIDDEEMRDVIINKIEVLGIKDKVIIMKPEDNMKDYYSALDIMIMPSLFEGLSLVALESQANGLPLLISDHLTPETYLTKYAIKVSKDESAEHWANMINKTMSELIRGEDTQSQFESSSLTKRQMLEEIENILLD